MSQFSQHHERHRLGRLAIAAVAGAVVAGVTALLLPVQTPAVFLIGILVFSLGFALPILWTILHADVDETRARVDGLEPGRTVSDLVILVGASLGLIGAGWMLLAKPSGDVAKVLEPMLVFAAVGSGWLLVHTMYALRYARHWFNAEPDCIEYHMDGPPSYSDFLYTAFAVGASFAISDTDLKSTKVRRIALGHSWLSYLYGTVIVAATINLIAGLAA